MALSCCKTDQPESAEVSLSRVEDAEKNGYDRDEDEIPGDFPEVDYISLYTLYIYTIISIPLLLSAGFTLSYVFTAGTVSYRCLVNECEDPAATSLYPSWLPNAIPYSNGEPTTCTRYTVLNTTNSCSTTVFTDEIEGCDAWIYNPEEKTILNEWELTCDNNLWKLALPGTINNVGQFVGLIFTGYLSDKYGRRNVLTVCTLVSMAFGLTRAFSVNWEMFVVFEFLDAVSATAIYSSGFVLGMEFVGPKKRVLISNFLCCMYAFGEILLALCAMFVRSWRYIIIAFYIPSLLAVFIPFLVPESVRWLLSKGRVKDAEAVLRKIAANNGVEVSQRSIDLIRNSENKLQEKKTREELESPGASPLKEVLGSRAILIRLLVCTFCWMTNTFVYYGLSLSSVAISGDKYINFILSALVEIPSQFASWLLVDYVGRRPTISGAFLLCGVFCILTIFVPEDWWYLPLIVFLGGKACITISFSAIYVSTAEIFPTPLRHSLLGFCSMTARIGSMISPLMPLLAVYMTSLPMLLYGSVAIIASVLSLHLPETMGTKLPETIDEAVNIGKVKKESKTSKRI